MALSIVGGIIAFSGVLSTRLSPIWGAVTTAVKSLGGWTGTAEERDGATGAKEDDD